MEKFAGIDWASEEHAVCVVDGAGIKLRERLVAHDEEGIAALCRELIGGLPGRPADDCGVELQRVDQLEIDRLALLHPRAHR